MKRAVLIAVAILAICPFESVAQTTPRPIPSPSPRPTPMPVLPSPMPMPTPSPMPTPIPTPEIAPPHEAANGDPALRPTAERTGVEEDALAPAAPAIAFFGQCPAAAVPAARRRALQSGETSPARFSACVSTLVYSAMPLEGACAACSR